MKLRYITRKNQISDEDIREYVGRHETSYSVAKRMLVNSQGPTLQYFDNGEWHDVESVTEYRDTVYNIDTAFGIKE